jgi:NAD(P)-dependent dehydrogenase (short-subunit alcohol dehydrogenase family)
MKPLEGKVIIVTGAGAGVGQAVAREAGRQGARVIVNDLGVRLDGTEESAGPAEETAAAIRAEGGEATANCDSVADWNSAHRIVQQAMDLHGRIDGVVNSAGNLRDAVFHKMTEEDFDAVIRVHLKGSFNVSRAAAPHMKAQESGAFVFMTSTAGLVGNFGQANYSAAKAGMLGLSKSIAVDMQKFNVRSNCIAPFAFTRMVASVPANTPEALARREKNMRMKPETIAPFTLALLSDATKHVSGQVFCVRNNEIFLFSQPRPLRSAHTSDGWTVQTCIDRAIPMLQSSFYPLDISRDVFPWDPV